MEFCGLWDRTKWVANINLFCYVRLLYKLSLEAKIVSLTLCKSWISDMVDLFNELIRIEMAERFSYRWWICRTGILVCSIEDFLSYLIFYKESTQRRTLIQWISGDQQKVVVAERTEIPVHSLNQDRFTW